MGRVSKEQLVHCGRAISIEELANIRETVAMCSGLSRSELALTISEHLKWRTASGSLKLDASLKFLEKLELQGIVKLPEKQALSGSKRRPPLLTRRTEAGEPLEGIIGDLGSVSVVLVTEPDEIGLWNEYMNRYHYLGYKQPFGCSQRYFITSERGLLGCLLFSGAAKALRERDQWIGWSKNERLRNLGFVINGKAVRRLGTDWQQRCGYQPVVVETFVDPQHYAGTCYRAANWLYLGQTTGMGLPRQGKDYTSSQKLIFALPLSADFRTVLCPSGEVPL